MGFKPKAGTGLGGAIQRFNVAIAVALKSYSHFSVGLTKFLTQHGETDETINYQIHIRGARRRACDDGMPDPATDGAEPAGNGRSNSIESGAIRYELSLRNRSSSFNERQPACSAGTLCFRLRSAALRIHGRCTWLRAAQDIHRRVSARRRLLRCSGAAVIWCAATP